MIKSMNESKYERMSIEDFDKYVNVRIEIEYVQEKEIVKGIGIITECTTGDRKISQDSKTIEDRIPFVLYIPEHADPPFRTS